jgi:choloylglycine hydrolase
MKKFLSFIVLTWTALLFTDSSMACTAFRLTAKDGTLLITRSMEYAMDLHTTIRTQIRGKIFNTLASDGKPGISWKSKFGYLYLDGMNIDQAIDGMNEKGLSFEALYLPGEAQYQTVPLGKDSQALPYLALGDWVLGNFETVDEVRNALTKVYVYAAKIPEAGEMIFPLHFSIYDASGNSIIVEYTKGKMQIYDNKIGMLTNSPTYDWQVTNLRNYLHLSPYSPQPITVSGITFAVTGQGAGSVGLPGDTSPPSRFVKTSFLKENAIQTADADTTLNLAEHIINNVDIPLGAVRAKQQNTNDILEFTQWVVIKDLTHKMFYYRSYDDPTLRSISMSKLDFSEHAPRLKMPISSKRAIMDVTNNFLQQRIN